MRQRRRRLLKALAILLLAAPVLSVATFQAAVRWMPYDSAWSTPPAESTQLLDRSGVPLASLVAIDGQWRLPVEQAQVGSHLLDAIVAVEDARFFQHGGVEWKAVAAAAWQNVKALHIRRGASTITMQLQRLRDPRPRTWSAKLDQAIRACQLERGTSKQQILLEYINHAPFGGNLSGAQAASWRYFGKPCANLSLAEAATLAGIPKNPSHLRPDRYPMAATKRRNHVLDRMLTCRLITLHQHDEACAEPMIARWNALPQDRTAADAAPADGAMPMLITLAEHDPGRSIRTTLDARIQRLTFQLARQSLDPLRPANVSAAAVVVLDTSTSQCLASVSLSDAGRIDMLDLTRRARSSGSTLKPLIYAAAFEAGICGPQTILNDSPSAWPGYEPADYDRAFRGQLPASEALAESRNIPALLVLQHLGVARAVGVMEAAGLATLGRSPDRYGLSLAIGGAEVTPMELAEAYGTLGRGGVYRPASCIIATGSVAAEHDAGSGSTRRAPQVFAPRACWQVLRSLSEPERTRGVCSEAASMHVAWKTGTSSGHRDAWCAAVTARHVVVVWMGNAAGAGADVLVGQDVAAPLALRLVALLDQGPASDWPLLRDTTNPPAALASGASRFSAASSLTLVSPAPQQEFVLDPAASPDRQRIGLKAASAKPAALWWFVDGEATSPQPTGETAWWTPTPGEHEVRVVNAAGEAASARFQVVPLSSSN